MDKQTIESLQKSLIEVQLELDKLSIMVEKISQKLRLIVSNKAFVEKKINFSEFKVISKVPTQKEIVLDALLDISEGTAQDVAKRISSKHHIDLNITKIWARTHLSNLYKTKPELVTRRQTNSSKKLIYKHV